MYTWPYIWTRWPSARLASGPNQEGGPQGAVQVLCCVGQNTSIPSRWLCCLGVGSLVLRLLGPLPRLCEETHAETLLDGDQVGGDRLMTGHSTAGSVVWSVAADQDTPSLYIKVIEEGE